MAELLKTFGELNPILQLSLVVLMGLGASELIALAVILIKSL